mgnify:CR=1 FL=1|jgi:hypothetical protein
MSDPEHDGAGPCRLIAKVSVALLSALDNE